MIKQWAVEAEHYFDKSLELSKLQSVLYQINEILACPAECGPILEEDTQTVRRLKGVIHQWHKAEGTVK
jgi:hypothetical protein